MVLLCYKTYQFQVLGIGFLNLPSENEVILKLLLNLKKNDHTIFGPKVYLKNTYLKYRNLAETVRCIMERSGT